MKYIIEKKDDDRIQSMPSVDSPDNFEDVMETAFSTFQSEFKTAATNPLCDSTHSRTSLGSATITASSLHESSIKEGKGEKDRGVDENKSGGNSKNTK